MLTVKCPQCSTMLKLASAPPSGRVKCPKCAAVVSVDTVGAATKTPAARPQAGRPAAAGRPVASSASADPDDDNFDFARISFPTASPVSAVSHFPLSGQKSVFQGPIPGDPLELAAASAGGSVGGGHGGGGHGGGHGAGSGAVPVSAKPKKPGMSTAAMIRMFVGLALLIVCAIIGGVVWKQRLNREAAGPDALAALQTNTPEGYRAVGIQGAVVLMPKGPDYDNLPSVIECMAVRTEASESVYFMGAMDGGSRPLDKDQMRKKAERQLGGEILGGQEMERNGYKGIKGVLDGSIFLPRMMVEVFFVDERFCILGCAPKSFGADPSVTVDRKLETEEQEIFYGSFKVGPKPGGWW